jgi:ABC-2 type transport system ATP-binding protein
MINASGLNKEFKTFCALKGVDMNVSKGEIYGFIGHNGAGKSTTMNILAGLSRPTSGYCVVNGRNIAEIKHPGELGVGYLPESPQFYSWMTAFETLQHLGVKIKRTRIIEILEWVGLKDSARRRVGGFSRGMKQRLGIGAALINDPALLILDEPSSALDPEGRADVLRLIAEMKKMGKTILFSTHILNDVERVCDTVGIISSGSMIFEKPLSELQRDNIRPIFDITLTASGPTDVISRLRGLDAVSDVILTENTLTVTVDDEAKASKNLMRFFSDHDISMRSLALRQSSLEELFLGEVKPQ